MLPRLHLALAIVLLLTSLSFAHGKKKTLNGYLVDIACATERSKELGTLGIVHTRQCLQMPDCQRSGYGVLTDDKQVIKFDPAGNEQAKALIASTGRPKDYRITVSGKIDDKNKDLIEVSKLELQP